MSKAMEHYLQVHAHLYSPFIIAVFDVTSFISIISDYVKRDFYEVTFFNVSKLCHLLQCYT